MGHVGNVADIGNLLEPLQCIAVFGRQKAQTVHAGIHFQMHIDRHFQMRFFKHFDLFVAMDGESDVVACQNGQLVRIKKAFQQQNRFFPAHFTQMDGRLDFDQCESVGIRKGAHGTFQAVAIGICLDDCPDFRPWHGVSDDGKIMLHGSDIDIGN